MVINLCYRDIAYAPYRAAAAFVVVVWCNSRTHGFASIWLFHGNVFQLRRKRDIFFISRHPFHARSLSLSHTHGSFTHTHTDTDTDTMSVISLATLFHSDDESRSLVIPTRPHGTAYHSGALWMCSQSTFILREKYKNAAPGTHFVDCGDGTGDGTWNDGVAHCAAAPDETPPVCARWSL